MAIKFPQPGEVSEESPVEENPAPEVEETPSEAPEVEDPSEEEPGEKPEEEPEDEVASAEAAPTEEIPPFTPDFKVRVMDKDHELPEFLRPLVTDTEKEKEIKELYTKALGLDYVKPKHEELQTQFQGFQKGFETLSRMPHEGKLQEFLDFYKIPKQALYEHVKAQLEYEQLAPEEKARVDHDRKVEWEARQGDLRVQQSLTQQQQLLSQMQDQMVDMALSRQDISAAAQEFDTRVGRPGAFRQEVFNRGNLAYHTTGKVIPVNQAIEEVMHYLGYVEQEPNAGNSHGKPPISQNTAPVKQKKLPTLPNLGNSRSAPVKKQVTSLAQLKEIRKKMAEG